MAELKTKQTDLDVQAFLNSLNDDRKKADSFVILELMQKITGEPPKMWGTSIIGFGSYHYKYASGRGGDWFVTGFSPRKQNLTLYVMDYIDKHQEILTRLGKHKTGKGCLYINKLEDVNMKVLEELIRQSVKKLSNK